MRRGGHRQENESTNKLGFRSICRGTTITLKLSPNLRVKTKAPKKAVPVDPHALEVQKLDRLLSLVRELPEGELVKETVSTVASN